LTAKLVGLFDGQIVPPPPGDCRETQRLQGPYR
jgi:hypothetical protein